MHVFAELPRETLEWFLWAAIAAGLIIGVLRGRRT